MSMLKQQIYMLLTLVIAIWLSTNIVEFLNFDSIDSNLLKTLNTNNMDWFEYLYYIYQMIVLFILFVFYGTLEYFNIYKLKIKKPVAEQTYSVKPSNLSSPSNQFGGGNYLCSGFYSGSPCLSINPNRIQRSWEFALRQAYDTYNKDINSEKFKLDSGNLCRQDSQCKSNKCQINKENHMPVCS